MITFGSVCSGIEAASVAWHPLGWRAAWLAEIEPFPSAVLRHHYPEVPNLGDMTTLPDRIRSGEIEAPDLFCGGTPCQAFSVAGLRRSLDDARGNLSLTFCEIADAIDSVRLAAGKPASIIFWENVPGVLSTADNAFGCFLAGLAGEDDPLVAPGGKWTDAGCVLGPQRTVAWRVLDAQFFGLAQRRRRVFVVASARDGFDPAAVLLEWEGVRRDTAPSREAGEGASRGAAAGAGSGDAVGTLGCNTGPRGHGFGDFLNNQAVDAGHVVAFGGGQNCAQTDVSTALSAHPGGSRLDFQTETFVTHSLRGEGFDASEDGTGRWTPLVPVGVTLHGTDGTAQMAGFTELSSSLRARIPSGVENSTTTAVMQPVAVAFHENQRGELTVNNTAGALKVGGGKPGQGYPAVALPMDPFLGGEVTIAIDASYAKGCGGTSVAERPVVAQAMQVRRLTPTECERLQGFPDNYTAIPWRGKPASECPDGPRYKALGNSWAVPVVRWIGRRIAAAVGQ
jgi:DNA (cytosine-5)-methyltransferase 1